MVQHRLSRTLAAALLGGAAAFGLAGCREDERTLAQSLPASAPLPYDFALAPPPMELPYAEPAPLGRLVSADDGYAWAERAYAMDEAFYDIPPDYGFAYDEVQPWAWRTADDWRMYAEPIDDGYRFYYYEPEAAYPYFVRDDRYGYGFDDGRLVTLYDLAGQLLPLALLQDQAPVAGRYLARAALLAAAADDGRRFTVAEPLWVSRAPLLVRVQTPWLEAGREAPLWVAYRERTGEQDLKRFEKERRKRGREFARIERAAPPDHAVARGVRGGSPPGHVERADRREDHKRLDSRDDRTDERRLAKVERRQTPGVRAERAERRKPEERAKRDDDRPREQARAADSFSRNAADGRDDRKGPAADRGQGGGKAAHGGDQRGPGDKPQGGKEDRGGDKPQGGKSEGGKGEAGGKGKN